MLTKKIGKTTKSASRKGALKPAKAKKAAKAAKKAYASRPASRPATWKKGGREWARILGHFGISTDK